MMDIFIEQTNIKNTLNKIIDKVINKTLTFRLTNAFKHDHTVPNYALWMLLPALLMFTLPSFAEQKNTSSIIKSYSANQIENSTPNLLNMTRDEVISKKNKTNTLTKTLQDTPHNILHNTQKKITTNLFNNTNKSVPLPTTVRSFSHSDFSIYDGYSQLIEDLDIDGYYRTFSVTFDADLITGYAHDEAIVYAELYLSKNGGPWMHYYSTDSFIIQGESSDDKFEVYSTLEQGFDANHYDVLIDLYEAGYSDIIASYSSADTNSLYALPLESSDYDRAYYTEEYVHGGSYSLLSLCGLLMLFVIRKLAR